MYWQYDACYGVNIHRLDASSFRSQGSKYVKKVAPYSSEITVVPQNVLPGTKMSRKKNLFTLRLKTENASPQALHSCPALPELVGG